MVVAYFEEVSIDWVIEYIPAYASVTVFYDILKVSKQAEGQLPYDYVCDQLKVLLADVKVKEQIEPRVVDIPVCYGGEFGPDLEYVAEYNGLSTSKVIELHSNGDYLVYMLGFAPGFPFIGGMDQQIATPRQKSPRLKIPDGTVGIANNQTGVYPIETPGGWQLIGRTPLKLFKPEQSPPTLLQAGDKIKFKPISYDEFLEKEAEQ